MPMAGMESYFKTLSTIPKNNNSCNFCEIPSFAELATVDLRGPMRQALQGLGTNPDSFLLRWEAGFLSGTISLKTGKIGRCFIPVKGILMQTSMRQIAESSLRIKKAVRSRKRKKSEPRFFYLKLALASSIRSWLERWDSRMCLRKFRHSTV